MQILIEHPMVHQESVDRSQVVHALAVVRQWFVEREEITADSSMLVPKVGFAEIMVQLARAFRLSSLEAVCAFGPHLSEELLFADLFKKLGAGLDRNIDAKAQPWPLNLGDITGELP